MGRGKKTREKKPKATLSPAQMRAVADARAVGLCPVFEAKYGQPLWLLHRLDNGRCVGFWNPASGRYKFGGETGATFDRREAFRVAAGRPSPPDSSPAPAEATT